MNQVSLRINAQEADYVDIESLPMSFRVQADEFTGIASPENVSIDNAAKRVAIPGTLRNQSIVEEIKGEAVPCVLAVDGAPSFIGKARVTQTERERGNLLGYGLQLLSGAKALFKELGGATLRGLNLGEVTYDLTEIEASWNYTAANSSRLAVWAPVYYGDTGDPDNNYTPSLLRPHPFVRRILEAIWKKLRVTCSSNLFDSPLFDRLVYLYGVGDLWNVTGNAGYEFQASLPTPETVTISSAPYLHLPNESIDTAGIFNGSVASLGGGEWTFEILVSVLQNVTLTLEITGMADIPLQANVLNQIGPIGVPSGSIARIRVDLNAGASSGTIFEPVTWRGVRSADPGIGDQVSIASCLHDKKITDFLSGLAHAFNLAFHFDPSTRVLTVDPRFDFKIQGVTYEGFYKRISQGSEDWSGRADITSSLEVDGVRPFGNFLALGYQPEDSNWWRQARFKGSNDGVPFLGARYEFSETGIDGAESRNPFFEDLILTGVGGTNIQHLPAMVPSDDQNVIGEPTYEGNPKLAIFAGNVDGYADWKWNGSVSTTRPVLYQQPKPENTTGQDLCITYSDYQSYTYAPTRIKGLASTFYATWLTQLERAKFVEVDLLLELHDLRAEADLFRTRKMINLFGESRAYIFESSNDFRPLEGRSSRCRLWEFVPPTPEDLVRLKHSPLTPVSNYLF